MTENGSKTLPPEIAVEITPLDPQSISPSRLELGNANSAPPMRCESSRVSVREQIQNSTSQTPRLSRNVSNGSLQAAARRSDGPRSPMPASHDSGPLTPIINKVHPSLTYNTEKRTKSLEESSEDEFDVHSLGERLTDVLETSMRSEASGASRTTQHSSLSRASFHIFKGNVGAGVFLLPTYYQDAGYGFGSILVVLLGMMMIDCALALLHAKQAINRSEIRTYPAVVEYILGSKLMHFTKFSLIFTQFGFCVVYIQYASSMFAALFNGTHVYHVFVVLSVLAVTPMTFFSNRMSILAYASMIAAVFVTLVLVGTAAVDVDYLEARGVATGTFFFVPTMRVLVFLSGHMFALEGIGVVLPVENSIPPEDRPRFNALVKYTLAAIVGLYIVFGILGYLAYGENLQTSVVLALPPSITKCVLQVLLGLSLIFGYPIQYVPAIQLVDKAMGVSLRTSKQKAYLLRVVLNVFFCTLAGCIGADTINIFASFLGAFTGVHLMITIPTLLALMCDHVVSGDSEDLSFGDYARLFFTMPNTISRLRWYIYLLVSACIWIGGTYYTFRSVFG